MKFKHLIAGVFACTCLMIPQIFASAAPAVENVPIVTIPGAVTTTPSVPEEDPAPNVPIDDNIVIAEGIYAGSFDLGGLTIGEARETLTSYYDSVGASTFTVTMNSQPLTTSLSALGFTYELDSALSQAAFLGQYGSLIQRYKDLTDLKYDKVILDVPYSVDQTLVENFVSTQVAALDKAPLDATLKRENGEFIVTEHVTGLSTDQAATVNAIMTAVNTNLTSNMTVAATVTVTEPTRTYEMLSTVSDKLGTFSTDYSDSKSGRKTNVKTAAGRLNGILLMPGESLSVSTTIKPRTAENGYAVGTEYVNGESVESIGGGVCQVSTTLYNALIRAEIQIDERSPHSMLVSYVKPSFDAAIANGSKDLKFTNNMDTPIYIASSANGSTLTFSIYGKETNPNRKVEFTSIVKERIVSETKEVLDPKQPLGFRESKGSNHDKCTSYLQKKVYENGVLVDTIQFEMDYYQASFKTVTIGVLIDPATGETYPGVPPEGTTLPDPNATTPAPSDPSTTPSDTPTEPEVPPEASGEELSGV